MKTIQLDKLQIDSLSSSFIDFVNSIDRDNIGFSGDTFFIKKVKIAILNENKALKCFLDNLKLGEYNSKRGYRTYENLKVNNKITKKQKKTAKIAYIYNEIDNNRLNIIINSDCLAYMKTLPDYSIDCILTSPPYNFGINYGDYYSDDNRWEDYFNIMSNIIKEMYRILTTGGRVIFNIQPFYSDYIPSHHIFTQLFLQHQFIWRNEILWQKNNYSARYTSWGSWKSPASPYIKYTHEYIEVYCKETIKHNNKRNVQPDITEEEFKRSVIGQWSIAPEKEYEKI